MLKIKKIRDIKMIQMYFKKSDWVLICNKKSKKFQLKWFEFYHMLKAHSFEIYILKKLSEQILWNLINEVRLIKTKCEKIWTFIIIVNVHESTKKKEFILKKSMKIQHIVNVYKLKTIFYLKLSIIIKKEWMK